MRARAVCGGLGVALSVMAGLGAAEAQVISVTGQERYIEAATHSVNPDGTSFDQGPVRTDAPAGFFGVWNDLVVVGGNMTSTGMQNGGWDGMNTITLDAFTMSISGGGPPMSAGSGTQTNVFQLTFDVLQNATYTLNAGFGCSQDVVLRLTLVGPGGSIVDETAVPNGPLTTLTDVTGSMAPGSYTLRLAGSGALSYDGGATGGGNGGGAGGSIPVLSLVVAEASCPADFNDSGSVTVQDIFDFLAAYFGNDASADFNGTGGITVQDIFDYLAAYFGGCP